MFEFFGEVAKDPVAMVRLWGRELLVLLRMEVRSLSRRKIPLFSLIRCQQVNEAGATVLLACLPRGKKSFLVPLWS